VRVLFLTHRVPFPPNRGDRIRAYHLLRHLRSFAEVDLVSLAHSAEEAAHAESLVELSTTVHVLRVPRLRNLIRAAVALPGPAPLTHVLLDAATANQLFADILSRRRPDVVVAYCSGMARFAVEAPLAGLPLVLDMVDVDSEKWAALARRSSIPRRWIYAREATRLARFEAEVTSAASTTVVVAEREREALARLAPGARIEVVPLGVDVRHLAPQGLPYQGRDAVFCGVLDYQPNVEGALWLAERVWPLVRRRYPEARLKLVGSNPTRAVRALAREQDGIIVTGHVPDVRPHLWSAAVSVAPLLIARGSQNKVLEAVAAGLPVVITSAAAEGLPSIVRVACAVADTPQEFAAAMVDTMALAPAERRARTTRIELSKLGWDDVLAPFEAIVRGAAAG
jgi:sugar transferase (PEP-CTERM/EpsH1 system associated)